MVLAGCATPNIERLSKQLGEGNAVYYLEVPTARGVIKIRRAVPNIGFGATVTESGGIGMVVPTNVTQNVQYMVPYAGTTNSVNR